MFKVEFYPGQGGMLVEGDRSDYAELARAVLQLHTTGVESACHIRCEEGSPIAQIVVRRGTGPIRITEEDLSMIIEFSAFWAESLVVAALEFPPDDRLTYPVRFHHHFEYLEGCKYIALDSLPAIFGLRY